METTTELVDRTDHSIYGLVVFLVILIFFASLTTGLILCLLKIWCSFHEQRRNSTFDQIEQPQIHGRNGSASSRRLPAISIDPTSDAMETLMKDLEGIPSRRNNYDDNDPANVIDV
uniref:Uncharacterized protein n=1 Tax=Caenorhabditis japonica TaxID=281687 RepID=A0A8R1DXU2_CAEJA